MVLHFLFDLNNIKLQLQYKKSSIKYTTVIFLAASDEYHLIENETNTDNYTEVNKQHLSLQNTYSPDLGVPNVCKLELNREKIARAMFYIVAISHGIWQVRFISIIWSDISTYVDITHM